MNPKLTFGWPAMRSPDDLPPDGQHVLIMGKNIYTAGPEKREICMGRYESSTGAWYTIDIQCGGEYAITALGWWDLPPIPAEH